MQPWIQSFICLYSNCGQNRCSLERWIVSHEIESMKTQSRLGWTLFTSLGFWIEFCEYSLNLAKVRICMLIPWNLNPITKMLSEDKYATHVSYSITIFGMQNLLTLVAEHGNLVVHSCPTCNSSWKYLFHKLLIIWFYQLDFSHRLWALRRE